MSNRSGQEEQILIAIDQLRRRKTRTDLDGICNFMQRRFLINPKRTITVLNMMLTASNAKVMVVSCKGGKGTSYRRVKPGVASPMKVGEDVNKEAATALVCGALSEMTVLEPQYLETGVPLDALEKFLYSKDKVQFSEPMVLALVRAELDKGSVVRNGETGNLEISQENGVEEKWSPLNFNKAMEEVKLEVAEKKAAMSKEAKRAARNEARKEARREARREAKREAEEVKGVLAATETNGDTTAPPATVANGGTSTTTGTVGAEGGRLRRKRAARVVFDPSDIPQPPRKKKPPAPSKEIPTASAMASKCPSDMNAAKIQSQDKAPTLRRISSQETLPISHGKTTSLLEKHLQEKENATVGKKLIQAKGSTDFKTEDQASQLVFLKLEKGFTRIQPSIEVKTLAPNVVKPAPDKEDQNNAVQNGCADRESAASFPRVKTYSADKTREPKMVEVHSSSIPKPAAAEKDAAKLLMKEQAIIQTQSIMQSRLASNETPPREAKTSPQQAKTDKSPPGTDKLAFALSAVCHVCHRPADDSPLMTCSDCTNTAHVRCTERRHALRRAGAWRCVHCKTCCVCAETDEYAAMVVCCRCEDAYHLSCHPTQEEEEGSANWLCAKCLVLPRDRLPIDENAADELETEASSNCSTPAVSASPAMDATSRSHAPAPRDRANRGPAPAEAEPDPEVPDAADWTVDQVADYFTGRGYHMQGKALRTNEVDGSSLLLMRRGDVITGLNLPLGPALKAFRQVRRLQLRQNDDQLLWA